MRAFEYDHVVGFQETNLVGNVYYVHYLAWQGRCREMFLRRYCPELLDELANGLAMATTRCSCSYLSELRAFDQVTVRMSLAEMSQNRITMRFEFWRRNGTGEEMVAQGEQQVALLHRQGERLVPIPIPGSLRAALESYRGT